jgi:hypothetical protein
VVVIPATHPLVLTWSHGSSLKHKTALRK